MATARSDIQVRTDFDEVLELARLKRQLPPPSVRKGIREAAGLSQPDVARGLGVTATSVSRYETGEREPRDPALLARYIALLRHLMAAHDDGP
jgi:HTH-type transcriptional regulator/antitoxin MqsA